MDTYDLIITTSVDGQESKISRTGKIEIEDKIISVQYAEESAQIQLRVENGQAIVHREGDYSLDLNLEEGKQTQGCIGIGGNQGDIALYASRVQTSFENGGVHVFLQYSLLFGEEAQRMKLHIYGKQKENEERKV